MLKIMHVVGARPNIPKVAPILAAMGERPETFQQVLVHTGQHYDYNMSKVFFEELEMRDPDEFLNVGSGSHALQTAAIMVAFELVVMKHRPDWVFLVGDVNSTVACALVCSKLCIPVAHVEAGLRSRDRTMPEEINRLLTDQISDLLFITERSAAGNLAREGIPPARVRFVGNVMIDSLLQHRQRAVSPNDTLARAGNYGNFLSRNASFGVVTLHRPSNVDEPAALREA